MSSKNAVSKSTTIRLYIVLIVLLISYFLIIFRLVDVSIMHDPESSSLNTFLHDVKPRGTIYDRSGLILATNLPTKSVYAKPDQISNIYGVSKAIAEIIQKYSDKPTKSFAERIASKLESARGFVWIKRHLLPEEYSKIKALGIPGIYFADDNKRFYQYENDFSHVVGFVDIDQNGIAGIEKKFDEELSEGNDVHLSLDSQVQEIVHTHLHNTVIEQEALGGMAILMDANNGEIISLVSLPDFNPNGSMNNIPSEAMFNRATLGVYEMGSTFKILTLAMGLDSSVVKLSDTFNVANPLKLGKYKINDYKFHKPILNLSELLIFSSNRGVAQVAYKIGIAKQQQYMRDVRMLSPVDLEITESAKPIHVSQKQWNDVYLATISYGYGVAVTAMHTVQAIAAVSNGGLLYKPTLIKQESKPDGVRVFKESTSKIMRKIMRLVVEEGYAKKANVDGYDVGGKTGTAEKIKNGKYIKKNCNFTFFVGAFPISNPKYVIIVGVDEPKPNKLNGGFTTGGAVAAPLAGLIIRDIGQLLGASQ